MAWVALCLVSCLAAAVLGNPTIPTYVDPVTEGYAAAYQEQGYAKASGYQEASYEEPGYGKASGYDTPSYGYKTYHCGWSKPKPTYRFWEPCYGYSCKGSSYSQPKTTYGAQQGYEQPQQGYGQPQASYGQPQASYGQPSYGYQQQQSGYQQQTYAEPQGYGSAQYGYDIPKQQGYGSGGVSGQFHDRNAAIGANPWQVAILKGQERQFLCSGVLIKDRYVLTAASCVSRTGYQYLTARLGEWDIKGNAAGEQYPAIDSKVASVTVHPNYDSYGRGYDVAILTLYSAVDFNAYPHITPICLPSGEDEIDDDTCRVAGWNRAPEVAVDSVSRQTVNVYTETKTKKAYGYGYDYHTYVTPQTYVSKRQEYSKVLQEAAVKKVERDWCQKELGPSGPAVGAGQECLFGSGSDEACVADVGSPVVCLAKPGYSYATEPTYEHAEAPYKRYRRDTHAQEGYGADEGSKGTLHTVYKSEFNAAPVGTDAVSASQQWYLCGVVSWSTGCSPGYKPFVQAGQYAQNGPADLAPGLIYGPYTAVYTMIDPLLYWILDQTH